MMLLTADLRRQLPALYATEKEADPKAIVKLFTPWTNWTWYITEFDGEDMCFGLVCGHENELGYFSLSELEEIRGPAGLKIERDRHFKPAVVSILKYRHSLHGHSVPYQIDRTR